jgi:hypothetical protein
MGKPPRNDGLNTRNTISHNGSQDSVKEQLGGGGWL